MSETAADVVFAASAEVLAAAAQIGQLPGASPESVRADMIGRLRQFVSRCRDAGIDDAEIAEARYALVAFIDDRVLKSGWSGREAWMSNPLQLQFFREYTAGENFFGRMRALLHRGEPFFALEVYYLCIALGFAGAMQAGGASQGARSYVEAARTRLLRGVSADRVAPNAIPTQIHRAGRPGLPSAAIAIAACVLVCGASLAGLHAALSSAIQRATPDVAAVKGLQSPAREP
ncbi:MAG TPA: DotU family type IV/VI secretion system protein [Polyangiaceae bacterium]|nr:DotU family type IV/VI secretion system protein [Polyangiaceae bacterium]